MCSVSRSLDGIYCRRLQDTFDLIQTLHRRTPRAYSNRNLRKVRAGFHFAVTARICG